MALYRAAPADGIAWITGASTGIGRELALTLAADGYVVAVSARASDKLSLLAAEASGLKGRILAYPCDVTDREAVARTVAAIESEAGPIVLSVFNAGNYFPTAGDALSIDNIVKTYEINVFGVVYGLVPVVQQMYARGRGHVVIVGSVSSYFGLPAAAAYGATKAAVNNMAEGLKFDFDKMNIRIQVINPGFVDTPLTEKNAFPMPALMQVNDAVAALAEGIRRGGFEVTFPRRFTWLLKIVRLLPKGLRFRLLNRATGWATKQLKPPRKS